MRITDDLYHLEQYDDEVPAHHLYVEKDNVMFETNNFQVAIGVANNIDEITLKYDEKIAGLYVEYHFEVMSAIDKNRHSKSQKEILYHLNLEDCRAAALAYAPLKHIYPYANVLEFYELTAVNAIHLSEFLKTVNGGMFNVEIKVNGDRQYSVLVTYKNGE